MDENDAAAENVSALRAVSASLRSRSESTATGAIRDSWGDGRIRHAALRAVPADARSIIVEFCLEEILTIGHEPKNGAKPIFDC